MRSAATLVALGFVVWGPCCERASPEPAQPRVADLEPKPRAPEPPPRPPPVVAPRPPQPSVSIASLAGLCRGEEPPAGVAPHVVAPGRASALLSFRREGEGEFVRDPLVDFEAWAPDDPSQTQLVACVSVTLEEIPDGVDVEPFAIEYEIRLLEASTGEELGRVTALPHTGDESYEVPLVGLVSAHQPRDAPPLTGFANASRIVCDGKPLPGAAPYDAARGATGDLVPLYVRLPVRAGVKDGAAPPQWDVDEEVFVSTAYASELVLCADGKRVAAKKTVCRAKLGSGAMHLYPVRYEVVVREAATAAVLARKSFAADADCPEVFKVRDPPHLFAAPLPALAVRRWAARWITE